MSVGEHQRSGDDAGGDGLFIDHMAVHGGGVRLVLGGDIDISSADQLRRELIAAVDDGRPVEIDMSDVAFLDSSGLRALVEAKNRAALGQIVVVVGASLAVRRVLDVTGLAAAFGLPTNSE